MAEQEVIEAKENYLNKLAEFLIERGCVKSNDIYGEWSKDGAVLLTDVEAFYHEVNQKKGDDQVTGVLSSLPEAPEYKPK